VILSLTFVLESVAHVKKWHQREELRGGEIDRELDREIKRDIEIERDRER
jgi:hypothetical protein